MILMKLLLKSRGLVICVERSFHIRIRVLIAIEEIETEFMKPLLSLSLCIGFKCITAASCPKPVLSCSCKTR
jgi:hypothetical protein